MPYFSTVSNPKSWKSEEYSKKWIHNIPDFDNPQNHRRSTCKNSPGNTIVHRFLQSIWFPIQRENGANASSIGSFQKNCDHYNDDQQKHKSNGSLTWWRHELLQTCCWSLQRGTLASYMFIICLDYVPQTSIDLIKENGFKLKKKTQGSDNIVQKL